MFCSSIFGYVMSQLNGLFGNPKNFVPVHDSLKMGFKYYGAMLGVVTSLKCMALLCSLCIAEFSECSLFPCITGRKLYFCTFF